MGNPTSPRLAAVTELIPTVSTQKSCYFDFMQPGAKKLARKLEEK
jgi:hypothetical protein